MIFMIILERQLQVQASQLTAVVIPGRLPTTGSIKQVQGHGQQEQLILQLILVIHPQQAGRRVSPSRVISLVIPQTRKREHMP